ARRRRRRRADGNEAAACGGSNSMAPPMHIRRRSQAARFLPFHSLSFGRRERDLPQQTDDAAPRLAAPRAHGDAQEGQALPRLRDYHFIAMPAEAEAAAAWEAQAAFRSLCLDLAFERAVGGEGRVGEMKADERRLGPRLVR